MRTVELDSDELDRIIAAAVTIHLRLSGGDVLAPEEIVDLCGAVKRLVDEVRRLRSEPRAANL